MWFIVMIFWKVLTSIIFQNTKQGVYPWMGEAKGLLEGGGAYNIVPPPLDTPPYYVLWNILHIHVYLLLWMMHHWTSYCSYSWIMSPLPILHWLLSYITLQEKKYFRAPFLVLQVVTNRGLYSVSGRTK